MTRIKKEDKVIIIAGKDKGKEGTVTSVLNKFKTQVKPKTISKAQHKNNINSSVRLIVEGVNLVRKHQKANPQKGQAGGIVEQERSIHISNVAILNKDTNKADKVRYKIDENNNKIRVYASTGEPIDL